MKKLVTSGILLLFSAINMVHAENNDLWNGEEYHRHSNSQWETATSLLKQISFQGNENILDIGSGDGKISALIADKMIEGSVLGIDVSPSMIEFATKTFSHQNNLNFLLMDAQELKFDASFDKVVSFTTFHWISNKLALMEGIWRSLKPDGILAFTVPTGPPDTFFQALADTINDEPWKEYFQGFEPNWKFMSLDEFKNLLEETQFKIIHQDLVLQVDTYPSKESFKAYVMQWLPHLKPLPQELKDPFLDQFIARFFELAKIDPQGKVDFRFYCVEMISQKNK